jgi:hypothetical protein
VVVTIFNGPLAAIPWWETDNGKRTIKDIKKARNLFLTTTPTLLLMEQSLWAEVPARLLCRVK